MKSLSVLNAEANIFDLQQKIAKVPCTMKSGLSPLLNISLAFEFLDRKNIS